MDQEELKKCLQFVESKIDGELLIEFKNTKTETTIGKEIHTL